MTTTTHTVAAMLAVAVAALDSASRNAKKETGAPLFALGQDMGNGIKFRELKAWAKEFAEKQKDAAPAPKAETKPRTKPAVMLDGPKPTATGKVFPVRTIDVTGSSNLVSCEYDRNTKTLTVEFKSGDVWSYADVSLKDVRELEAAKSKGSHFSKVLKPVKAATKVNGGAVPKVKAETKPAAKAPADVVPVSTSELREKGFYANRKHEQVAKIVRNKETDVREIIAVSGTRYALDTIIEVKGKFRVSDLATVSKVINAVPAPKTGVKPAPKEVEFEAEDAPEFTAAELRGEIMQVGRKTDLIEKVVRNKETGNREIITESGARYEVSALRKNNRGKFVLKDETAPAKTEAKAVTKKAPAKAEKHETRPATRDDLIGNEVRVTKGTKTRMVKIIRVVNRNEVRTAVTETKAGLPFAQIMIMDGVPTYVGKTLPIADFRAL